MLLVTVVGILAGILLHRFPPLRAATETWVAALASAPIVLDVSAVPGDLRPLAHDHRHHGVHRRAAAGDPEDHRRARRHAPRADRCRPQLQSRAAGSCSAKILFPAALPTIFVGLRLGLIFCLINIVGVEFLINFGGLGQIINDLAERYDLPGTYAAIGFVILTSVLFFVVTERIERWLRPQS